MTTDPFIAHALELGPGHRGWMEWHKGATFGRLEDPHRDTDRYDAAGMDPFRLTLRLLRAVGHHDLATVVATIGPNGNMHPSPGLYGFMARPHLLVVLHAVDLAHTALHTEGWPVSPLEDAATFVTDHGLWSHMPAGTMWDDAYARAVTYYHDQLTQGDPSYIHAAVGSGA